MSKEGLLHFQCEETSCLLPWPFQRSKVVSINLLTLPFFKRWAMSSTWWVEGRDRGRRSSFCPFLRYIDMSSFFKPTAPLFDCSCTQLESSLGDGWTGFYFKNPERGIITWISNPLDFKAKGKFTLDQYDPNLGGGGVSRKPVSTSSCLPNLLYAIESRDTLARDDMSYGLKIQYWIDDPSNAEVPIC
jgi:hypothetical protein